MKIILKQAMLLFAPVNNLGIVAEVTGWEGVAEDLATR